MLNTLSLRKPLARHEPKGRLMKIVITHMTVWLPGKKLRYSLKINFSCEVLQGLGIH